jgi:hypothetical protein
MAKVTLKERATVQAGDVIVLVDDVNEVEAGREG